MTEHKIVVVNTTSPILLSPPGTHSGVDITIQNVNSEGYIYLGGNELTSSSYGFRIDPSHAISFELSGKDDIYAIGSTNGLSLSVLSISLEQGQ